MNTANATTLAAAPATVTREQVIELLNTRPAAAEKAILALYARQTEDEQPTLATRHSNGRGFNASDARKMSFIAEFLRKGGHMKAETCRKHAPRLRKYAGQLVEVANANLAAKAAANTASN